MPETTEERRGEGHSIGATVSEMVDSVVPMSDDVTCPALTFRVWVIGFLLATCIAAFNTIFTFRTNTISLNAFIGALVALPLGVAWSRFIPFRKFLGISINPGTFTVKEHALIFIFCSTASSPAYALFNIIAMRYQLAQQNLSITASILFGIVTQCFGYGLAGLCRRFLVQPLAMVWPGNLAIVAFLTAIHQQLPPDTNNVSRDSDSRAPESDTAAAATVNGGSLVQDQIHINGANNDARTVVQAPQRNWSRQFMFWFVTVATACYQFLPSFVAPILTSISILCYLSPPLPTTSGQSPRFSAKIMRGLGSAQPGGGVGLFSISLDWSIIGNQAPITTPLWAMLNQLVGVYIMLYVIVPILWVNNRFGNDFAMGTDPADGPKYGNGTGRFKLGFALNTPSLFTPSGRHLGARDLINTTTLSLHPQYTEALAGLDLPVRISTYFAVEYAASFAVFAAAISHVGLWYGRDICVRFLHGFNEMRRTGKSSEISRRGSDNVLQERSAAGGATANEQSSCINKHAVMMESYPDVPDIWFICLLVVTFPLAIAVCQPQSNFDSSGFGKFDLPWWGVLLAFGLAAVSVLPIGTIQAISGQQLGLNVVSELIAGCLLPGRIISVMTFKTLSYMAMSQALFLVADMKLGQYLKIPPRQLFIVQLVSTVWCFLLNLVVACWMYESFGKVEVRPSDINGGSINETTTTNVTEWRLESANPPEGWTANAYAVFLSAGSIWGAIGPLRFFNPHTSPYGSTLFGFLVGFIAPFIFWGLHKVYGQKKGGEEGEVNGQHQWWWQYVNVPLIAAFPVQVGGIRSDMLTPLIVALFFNYYLKRKRYSWWKRYAYIMSAALDSGSAIGVSMAFFILSMRQISMPQYVLNPSDGEGCVAQSTQVN